MPRLLNQANRQSFARLERAMERILAADEAIKTGKLGIARRWMCCWRSF